jgi:hypothetical protein
MRDEHSGKLIISVYFRNDESEKPSLLKRYTIKEYCQKLQKDVDKYQERLTSINKKTKTYRKVKSKILLLQAYIKNIGASDDKEDLSQVFATSGMGRYRIENEDGALLPSVYEQDGRTIYRFQYESEIEEIYKREQVREEEGDDSRSSRAWERLKNMLDKN